MLSEPVRQLIPCGGGYSFTSSHATNHFAVAFFLFLTWGRLWKRWRWLLLLWAATIALGQVYVGVHYPLDITVGALLGMTLAWGISILYKRWLAVRISEFYHKPQSNP
ncbi:MAG: phosphatase PAP2 family protein [Saprospiraceae bacterium]